MNKVYFANREPVEIDINDWEMFGGGYTAESFNCKSDHSLMLKLYADFMKADEGLNELETSAAVKALGLPTAMPVAYVKCGNRYGAVFERIQGKRSFSRLLADHPEKSEAYAKVFADISKTLHGTKCDTGYFPSMADLRRNLAEQSDFLSEEQKDFAIKLIDSTPSMDSCVHGDFHIGNIVLDANDKPLLIDLPDFAYGNPLFDLGTMMMMARYIREEVCMHLYHIDRATYAKFWEQFIGYYFNGESVESVENRVRPYVGLQCICFVHKNGINDELLNTIKASFGV